MKRILIALAMLAGMQIADAQVKSPDAAKKAVESALEASKNEKKAAKVATWTKTRMHSIVKSSPNFRIFRNNLKLFGIFQKIYDFVI